jgi:hypothetical protein
MPIWGYDLFTGEGDDETAHQQVLDREHRIVTYVESLQEPHPAPHLRSADGCAQLVKFCSTLNSSDELAGFRSQHR